jgi:CyaY protein
VEDTEFTRLADEVLQHIAQAFDQADIDADSSLRGEGVLEVEFEQGGRIIINRHAAARELWVAARSGGFHFRNQDGRWLGTRDGRELFAVLSQLAAEQTGRSVNLEAPP